VKELSHNLPGVGAAAEETSSDKDELNQPNSVETKEKKGIKAIVK